ncbi:MAG: hypothetical protein HFH91_13825 [Lachnospiraceae bacterium]|nr:hypothetical protein [Lachnospiraceae bacterium]
MTVLEKASCHVCWQEFLDYKAERQQLYPEEEKELREFVERRAYLPLCEAWERGEYPAQYPVKKEINKQGVRKKRIVYTFPGDEGVFLKFVAFQLYAFDGHFCENCYAFRRRFGVRDAIRRIRHLPGLEEKYCLKADISDYFNSIPVEKLLERLFFVREADPKLYALFERILGREEVWEEGRLVAGRHGAMAGIPLSPFFANVYLGEADAFFQERDIPYFRYSDDILIFADTERELSERQEQLYGMLEGLGLSLNPRKVQVRGPGEAWEFLGFCYRKGEIDLSDATLRKMKAKVRRKAEALRRWQRKKGLGADKAAIGLIHAMNRKFYGASPPEAGRTSVEEVDVIGGIDSEDGNGFAENIGFDIGRIDTGKDTGSRAKGKRMEDATGSEAEGKRMEDTADFGTEGGKMRGNTGSEIEIENMKESASLSGDSDFTWSRWYFPNITTDAGLREIDAYFMEYIRYTVTGRHYKGNYRISYAQLKAWGYRSLVHEYYRYREGRYGF